MFHKNHCIDYERFVASPWRDILFIPFPFFFTSILFSSFSFNDFFFYVSISFDLLLCRKFKKFFKNLFSFHRFFVAVDLDICSHHVVIIDIRKSWWSIGVTLVSNVLKKSLDLWLERLVTLRWNSHYWRFDGF